MLRRLIFKSVAQSTFKSNLPKSNYGTTNLIQNAFASRKAVDWQKLAEHKKIEAQLLTAFHEGDTAQNKILDQITLVRRVIDSENNKNIVSNKLLEKLQGYTDIFLEAIQFAILNDVNAARTMVATWPDGGYSNPNKDILAFFEPLLKEHGITFKLKKDFTEDDTSYFTGFNFNFADEIKPLPHAKYSYYKDQSLPELQAWLIDFNNQIQNTITQAKNNIETDLAKLNKAYNNRNVELHEKGWVGMYKGSLAAFKRFKNENDALDVSLNDGFIRVNKMAASRQCKR